MLNAGLEERVIGFSFDGTGLGSDGNTWGAEVLSADYLDFERLFHFEYIPLPGGDRAVNEPWRMGISYLYHCYGEESLDLRIPLNQQFDRGKTSRIFQMISQGIQSPMASSAGRLFDAVAAIVGLNYYSTYQAEAPMKLQSVIDRSETGRYPCEVRDGLVSFKPLIRGVVEDLHLGISPGTISAKFHHSLVELIVELAVGIKQDLGLDRVVLAGGTFQNRYLTEKVTGKLERDGFKVYIPHTIPMNDQGIAVGQVAIGACRRSAGKIS